MLSRFCSPLASASAHSSFSKTCIQLFISFFSGIKKPGQEVG